MNKTEAIRDIAKAHLHWTNQQLKQEVKRKHGLIVSSSAIINAIGSHKKRLAVSSYSIDIRKKAREFLRMAGDYDQARNLLALAETE